MVRRGRKSTSWTLRANSSPIRGPMVACTSGSAFIRADIPAANARTWTTVSGTIGACGAGGRKIRPVAEVKPISRSCVADENTDRSSPRTCRTLAGPSTAGHSDQTRLERWVSGDVPCEARELLWNTLDAGRAQREPHASQGIGSVVARRELVERSRGDHC
jgi:hypothetical protein